MRIALVVHELTRTYGHSRYVTELAERFRDGHDVHVFANRADHVPDGVRLHRVPAVRVNALSTILTFAPAAALAVGSGFDVVHAQGVSTLRCNVVTAHICLASWFASRRDDPSAAGWRQRLFEQATVPLERRFYHMNRDAWTIAISRSLRNDLATEYGVRERVEVIPHGVDTAQFTPRNRADHRLPLRRALGVDDRTVLALFVGDLRRGARPALEAVARTPGLHLALVSRSDVAPFVALAQQLGIDDRTHFEPPTSNVERYYAAADLFVFPTPYDAFGMVIAEAMASGLPVVTTRRAGAADLITSGVDGLLVDGPDDVDALASHLATLAADASLRTAVGEAARRRVERQDWDDVAQRTLAVYERAVASRRQTLPGHADIT
jgi:glycosyltransferase involved in cell wall biosynthesis